MAGLSFAFDPSVGETPADLERRRALSEALVQQALGTAPTTIGGGINALGAGIGAMLERNRISQAQAAGRASGDAAFSSIFGGMGGQAQPVAGVGAPAGDAMAAYRDGIAQIESGGRYDAIGPTHPKLGRALGKYQIMEANIGPWSREVLGREVSPQEFLANPSLQDAIFDGKFGSYVAKYGPEGAARAWIGGPGAINKTERKDSLGTSVGDYGQRFMRNISGQQAAVADALMGGGGTDTMVGSAGQDRLATPPPQAPEAIAPQMGFDPFTSRGPAFDRVANTGHDSLSPGQADVARALMTGAGAPASPAPVPSPASVAPVGGRAPAQAPAPQTVPQTPSVTPAAAPGQSIPQQGGNPQRLQQLMVAASNPWLSPQQRALVEMELQREMAARDPKTQLEIQKLQADINKAQRPDTTTVGNRVVDTTTGQVVYEGAPEPTTNMRDYQAYAEYERAQGREPLGPLEYERELRKSGAASTNVTVNGEQQTPGQKKVDEAFADDYLEWTARGGFADVEKQIEQLELAANDLAQMDGITGPAVGMTPDWALAWANPNAIRTREAVQEVVQRNLRLVLGPQFTEKEGERLIARAYNPSLSQAENAERVRRLMASIVRAAEARESASQYFAENGTLMGWQGRLPTKLDIENSLSETKDSAAPDVVDWQTYFRE